MSFIPPLETLYNKVIKIKICSTFPSLGFSNTPERRRADTTEESKITQISVNLLHPCHRCSNIQNIRLRNRLSCCLEFDLNG